jgi:hypothetical protein
MVYKMTSTETNPFVLKDFLVVESPINSQYSLIVLANDPANNVSALKTAGYTISQPMNILELEQYLTIEINKFLMHVRFARTCDNYIVHGLSLPSNCISTFKNYNTQMSQFGIGDAVLDNFVYTDSYINAQQNANDKKSLSQRLRDLQSMLTIFQEILGQLDTEEIKKKYPDQYNNIMQKYKQNISMRTILDQKLDNIYSNESSYGNSKRFLDSTVYTSVLWTILATTLVFYIFKKM